MGTADPKVRLRIFNYLRTSGIEIGMANLVASRCVGAMVNPGKLPDCVVAIAGAAISPNPSLDHMDETKSLALLEPKAEPFEAWPARSKGFGTKSPMTAVGGKMPSSFSTSTGKIGAPSTGGLHSSIGGGRTIDFAIIEPVITRREVIGVMGTRLGRTELQAHVATISRSFR